MVRKRVKKKKNKNDVLSHLFAVFEIAVYIFWLYLFDCAIPFLFPLLPGNGPACHLYIIYYYLL